MSARIHIFDDLQPYVCTAPGCEEEVKTFKDRIAWARHEAGHRTTEEAPRICPFCPKSREAGPENSYYRHVGHHLREIALAVLPQGNETEDEDGSDSSRSDSDQCSNGGPEKASVISVDQPIEDTSALARSGTDPEKMENRTTTDPPENDKPQFQACRYKTGKTLAADEYSVVKECLHLDTGRYYSAKVISKRMMQGREHLVSLPVSVPFYSISSLPVHIQEPYHPLVNIPIHRGDCFALGASRPHSPGPRIAFLERSG